MARIWIVEDDENLLNLYEDSLKGLGHACELFRCGDAVVERVEDPSSAVPDLVLLDVMMPGIDGHSLALLLTQEPRTRHVPIIVMTAKEWSRSAFASVPSVVAFMLKPFSIVDLRAEVAKALSRGRPG